jgi:hypothetical protein
VTTRPPADQDESSVVFDGINQDRQDALEIANFGRAAKTPQAEGGIGTVSNGGRLPEQLAGVATGFVAAWVLGQFSEVAGVIGFFAGSMAPMIVRAALDARGMPKREDTRERFVIRITQEFVIVESPSGRQEHPTGNVLSFGAGKRIELVRRDGTKAVLPCVLPTRQHGPLVDRLNAILATNRTWYR